jgi:gliding motility-associated-like protein
MVYSKSNLFPAGYFNRYRYILQGIALFIILLLSVNLPAQIVGGNCFIQGQYVELGIGPCGTFGTSINAPPGYHPRGGSSGNPLRLGFVADQGKDGWSVGSPNYCGDYYVPGTPEEGWGITVNGISYNNSLLCALSNVPGSITDYRNNGSIITGTWAGNMNGLAITSKTLVPVDKLYFLTEITLKNTTTDTLRDIYYMRNIDPDNEVTLTGVYTTRNTIINQNPNPDNKAVVTAEGLQYGCFIALGTRDCRAKVTYGGFSNRNASAAWHCMFPHSCSGTNTADIAISIAFQVGDLLPGRQTSLKFVNVLNIADLDEAVDLTGPSFEVGHTDQVNSGDTTSICSSGPTVFEVVNTGGFDNWTWSPATGLNTTTGPAVICDGSIDTLSYTATGINSCGGSVNIHFTAIKGNTTHVPKAGPISGPLSLCLPNTTATYSIEPIPRATGYVWNVPPGVSVLSGDGTNSITVDFGSTIRFDSISVYGINVCGPGDTSMIRVAVCDCNTVYPVAPATATICQGDSVLLTTSNISGAIYKWYRNGVLVPALAGHSIYVSDSGYYTAVLLPNDFCSNNTSISRVDFASSPRVSLSPQGKLFKCEGSPLAITANVAANAPGAVILDWYKDGVLVAPNGPVVFTANNDGIYSVRVTNSNNCKSVSASDTIQSYKRPELIRYTFEGDPVTCAGRNSVLKSVYSSQDGSVIGWQWYNNGIPIPGATDPLLTVNSSGNYSIELTTSNGCKNIIRDTALVFYPTPVAAFDIPDGCVVKDISFHDISSISAGNITNWSWKKNGTVFSTVQHPATDLIPNTYLVQLIVKSDKGCFSDPKEISFIRYGKPVANFTIKGTCADSLTLLEATSIDPGYGNTSISSWNWDLGNGLVSSVINPSLIYDSAGYYTIRLVYNGDNCPAMQDSMSRRIYLGESLPAVKYNNVVAIENEPFVLYGGADGVSYEWYPAIGLTSPFSKTTTGKLNLSQLYHIHIRNSYGCGRIDTVQVVIINACKIYVPSAFTPNNDGKNESLRGYFGCLKTLNQFSIFNRWGQRIFTTKNGTQAWDGKYNGKEQPTGTYVWIAEGEFEGGKKFSEKGLITLIR